MANTPANKRQVQTPGDEVKTTTENSPATNTSAPADDAFQANAAIIGDSDDSAGDGVDTAHYQGKNEGKAAADAATAGQPVAVANDVAALQAQVMELAAMLKDVQAKQNRSTASMPVQEKLPTMKETLAKKPEVPVLTEEGWYVPAVTLATRA